MYVSTSTSKHWMRADHESVALSMVIRRTVPMSKVLEWALLAVISMAVAVMFLIVGLLALFCFVFALPLILLVLLIDKLS